MLPPSMLLTAALTIIGLTAMRVMLSLPLLLLIKSRMVTPTSVSTVPMVNEPTLRTLMSPLSVAAASVRVGSPPDVAVSISAASVPMPVAARSTTLSAVMRASSTPASASTIAPPIAVAITRPGVVSEPLLVAATPVVLKRMSSLAVIRMGAVPGPVDVEAEEIWPLMMTSLLVPLVAAMLMKPVLLVVIDPAPLMVAVPPV